jgi:hypothetical protein
MDFAVNAITILTGSYFGQNLFNAQAMQTWVPCRKANCTAAFPASG